MGLGPPKRKKGQHAFALPQENGAGRRPRASQGAPSAGLGTWISDFSAPRTVTNKHPLAQPPGHGICYSSTSRQGTQSLWRGTHTPPYSSEEGCSATSHNECEQIGGSI